MKLADQLKDFTRLLAEDTKEREYFLTIMKDRAQDAIRGGKTEIAVFEIEQHGANRIRNLEWMARVLEEEGLKVSYHRNPADRPGVD